MAFTLSRAAFAASINTRTSPRAACAERARTSADATIPFSMGRKLYELANEPKTFVTMPGAAHQDFPLDIMAPAIRTFLEGLAAGEQSQEH